MSPAYEFAGLVGGLTGLGLVLLALLVGAAAALRLLQVRRRPGRGRWARGALGFAGACFASGAVLYGLAETVPFRRGLDRAALAWAAVSLAVALVAGWRCGRGPSPERPPAPPAGPAAP